MNSRGLLFFVSAIGSLHLFKTSVYSSKSTKQEAKIAQVKNENKKVFD